MTKDTAFEPRPGVLLNTELHAGYRLAGRERGRWRPTVRFDLFSLRQGPDSSVTDPLSEHGNALALNWHPQEKIRVTGELLRIDSSRNQRALAGLSPRQVDVQLQLGMRLLF
ncbi:MAG: hypothetical protein LH470_08255 [Lysobacter sp.]|nr:hypothetical protein [Lysobacter sp.]